MTGHSHFCNHFYYVNLSAKTKAKLITNDANCSLYSHSNNDAGASHEIILNSHGWTATGTETSTCKEEWKRQNSVWWNWDCYCFMLSFCYQQEEWFVMMYDHIVNRLPGLRKAASYDWLDKKLLLDVTTLWDEGGHSI